MLGWRWQTACRGPGGSGGRLVCFCVIFATAFSSWWSNFLVKLGVRNKDLYYFHIYILNTSYQRIIFIWVICKQSVTLKLYSIMYDTNQVRKPPPRSICWCPLLSQILSLLNHKQHSQTFLTELLQWIYPLLQGWQHEHCVHKQEVLKDGPVLSPHPPWHHHKQHETVLLPQLPSEQPHVAS